MRQGTAWPILFLVFLVVASGCTGSQQNPDKPSPQNPQEQPAQSPSPQDGSLVGTWRNYVDTRQTRMIEVKADHTWVFGPSNGTWRVEDIQPGDWEVWGRGPNNDAGYSPAQKMVLVGWNKGTFSGPILEGPKGVDFFYVVYKVEPPAVSKTMHIYIKFGRPDPLD